MPSLRTGTQKSKRAEQDFAKRMGSAFTHALEVTTMVVRSEPKLVGLDKIRAPLAWKAALKATGFPGLRGFQVPADAGRPDADIQRLVDALFEHAVLAARAARDVVLRASCK